MTHGNVFCYVRMRLDSYVCLLHVSFYLAYKNQLKGRSCMKHVTVCVQKAHDQSNLPSFTWTICWHNARSS